MPAIPMESKAYAIVSFLDEGGSVEVIPTNWILSSSEAKWPNISSINVVTKFITERKPAEEKWEIVRIKIYGYSNSFKSAKYKANVAQDTSNIGSDSSENEITSQRKRKRPSRFEITSDDSSTDIGSESIIKKHKTYTVPNLPKVSSKTSLNTLGVVHVSKGPEKSVPGSSKFMLREASDLTSRYDSTLSAMSSESWWSQSQTTKEEAPKDLAEDTTISRLFKYMELLHSQLKDLNTKYGKIESQLERLTTSNEGDNMVGVTSCLPSGVELPIATEEALQCLNEKLKVDKQLSTSLVHYLYNSAGGKSCRSFILSISKKVLSQEIAVLYSRFGRKGKKSFSHYNETLNVILAAAALKFKNIDREDLSEMFGKALANAVDWNGRIRPLNAL